MNKNQPEPWISLKESLPPPNEKVLWYDAMFDDVMLFALPDPSRHDSDFTHWMPRPRRPKKYQELPKRVPAPLPLDAVATVRKTIHFGIVNQYHKINKDCFVKDATDCIYDNMFNKAITWAIKEIINDNPIQYHE